MTVSFVPRAVLICALAGMRTVSPHALMSIQHLLEQNDDQPAQSFLDSPAVTVLLLSMAAGELLIDKLPFTPNRTTPVALAGRILSGAVAGALLWRSHKRPYWQGIVIGALAAALNTIASFYARRLLGRALGVPDLGVALVEDGIVYGLGWQLIQMIHNELPDRA